MKETIMAITIEPRNANAPEVQQILTKHGCIIKTRVGLHDISDNTCSQRGLILLHICEKEDESEELKEDLSAVDGVKVNTMVI
ncbi:hypothetical protein OW763_03405 [Clostridium aestuarii]|uniref:Iron-only hydrogenase system regulator n=1 Tax=Clostridium aestuarii TaxID=338193 RepID=A0ABT4CWN1_9CLOT|nr:hypothetical protein [Clostridium aestuarii]MCY6483403.1 hypothetical protein [Clostridium aestuarii]